MKFKLFARLKNEKQVANRPNTNVGQTISTNTQNAPQTTQAKINPIDEVRTMIQNGLSEAEIIQILKEEGYAFDIIDEALNTVLKTTITGESTQPNQFSEEKPPQNLNNSQNQMFGNDFTQKPEFSNNGEDFSPQNAPTKNTEDTAKNLKEINDYNTRMEEIENTVTTLVDEKLGQINDIRKETENQFVSIIKDIELLKQQFAEEKTKDKNLETKELEDISTITTKFNDIEPRLSAIEKAFKDIIPNVIENVRDIKERLTEKEELPTTKDYIKPHNQEIKHTQIPKEVPIEKSKEPNTKIETTQKHTEKDLFNI